jgi:hypothetical protein
MNCCGHGAFAFVQSGISFQDVVGVANGCVGGVFQSRTFGDEANTYTVLNSTPPEAPPPRMVSKGFKMRLQLAAQIGVVAVATPIAFVVFAFGGYDLMRWSYGGPAEFRRIVISEPLQEGWHADDPTVAFGRSAPLSAVPQHINAMPKGDDAATRSHTDF